MNKIKVSEATNIQLDWLVWNIVGGAAAYPKTASGKAFSKLWRGNSAKYLHPTTDWAQGGPIIERGEIAVIPTGDAAHWEARVWQEGKLNFLIAYGATPLIAAARCYVMSELGEEVEVPEELM